MVEKYVKINVDGNELDNVAVSAKKAEKEFDKLEDSAKKADSSIDEVTKNGGAIAILDQLTGGLATRFRDAYESTKLFNFSLKGTKTALLATGIGAAVVAIGALVAYWDDIVDYVTGYSKGLEEANALLQRQKELTDAGYSTLEKQKKLLEIQGLSTVEINKKLVEQIKLQQEINGNTISNLEAQLEYEKSKVREVTLWEKIKILGLETLGLYGEAAKASVKAIYGNEEQQQKINELAVSLEKAKGEAEDLKVSLFELQNPKSEGKKEETRNGVSALTGLPTADIQEEEFNADLERLQKYEERRTSIQKTESEARKVIAEQEKEYKRAVLSAEADIVGQFGGVLQQLGEKNKTLAVAGIIAEQIASTAKIILATGEANAKAVAATPLTLGQPWVTLNTISAGLSIASGALAASKAISQLGKGGSVSTQSIPSVVGGGGSSAPSFNIVGNNQGNQIAESLAKNPIKAYVVSKDMTNKQEFDRNTLETASI